MTERIPAVTVIIAMYKGERTVRRMINNVLNQTFSDFELILVDDGSPDSCGEIGDEYAQRDSRVSVIHQENKGLSGARNSALDIARGEFTIQFDQDDWVEPNCLEEMVEKVRTDDVDMVICDYYHEDASRCKYTRQQPTALDHWSVLEDIVTGRLFGYCWNKLIRRSVYEQYHVRFPLEIYGCEDQYGMCQMLVHPLQVAYLPKAFCHYVYSANSLSRHYDDRTFLNDLKVRDMFTELLKNTPSGKTVFIEKSGAVFYRAFLFGYQQYNSRVFKEKFSEYYPYVKGNRIERLLYFFAKNGFYHSARWIFGMLFELKQISKKFISR